MKRTFYAVYVADHDLAQLLNCVVLVCNPLEKWPAHITVRGPYDADNPRERSARKWDKVIRNRRICVDGPGAFLGPKQATVFLKCDSPQLKQIWWKKDYGFEPHLTIYDGGSQDFADRLYDVLTSHDLDFCFRASALSTLESIPRQLVLETALWSSVSSEEFQVLTGLKKRVDVLRRLSEHDRIRLVDALFRKIVALSSRRDRGTLSTRHSALARAYRHPISPTRRRTASVPRIRDAKARRQR